MPDITFVTTFWGDYCEMGWDLVDSIRKHHPDSEIIVWFPIGEEQEEIGRTDVEIVVGKLPDDNWKQSAKHQALVDAREMADSDWLCLLDADTLLLRPIESDLFSTDADLMMKAVDIGDRPWGRHYRMWERLYGLFDADLPDDRVMSTVDRRMIPPYFNGGVIFCRSSINFPTIWRNWVSVARDQFDRSTLPSGEQEVLGVLSQIYEVDLLTEDYNFPLPHRTSIPISVRILHHHGGV